MTVFRFVLMVTFRLVVFVMMVVFRLVVFMMMSVFGFTAFSSTAFVFKSIFG